MSAGKTLKPIFKTFTFFIFVFICFSCSAAELNFTIVHSSDEHSSLVPTPYAEYLAGPGNSAPGGFARLAGLVKKIKAEKGDEPVILLSSGDFSGGTPFSWLTLNGQTAELSLMQEIGYLAVTTGNHEFDFGPDTLAAYLIKAAANASFPQIIASNLEIPKNHPMQQAGIRKFFVHQLSNGLKVGIFALMGQDAQRLSPAAKPLSFSNQQQCAQNMVTQLQKAGAEVIIALTHCGYAEDEALVKKVSGIHLVLGGHEHLALATPRMVNQTMIMHSGAYLESVGRLDLAFDRAASKLRLRNSETQASVLIKLNDDTEADPAIEASINLKIEQLNQLIASFTEGAFTDISQTAVRSDFALTRHQAGSETAIGNFITDGMRLEVEKITGHRVDLALHANGIIRGNLLPAASENVKGNVSLYDLITLSSLGSGKDNLPGYALVSFYLTEKEVLNLLEIGTLLPMLWNDIYFLQFSGIRYRYDPDRAFWMWLPIINKPLPAYASILQAEIYTGPGRQTEGNYKILSRENNRLCHVVTTHYLASYLPMVGSKLPRLNLVLKDRNGKAVELDQTIIRLNQREFKLWEATARHVADLASAPGEIGTIPHYYREVGNRIVKADGGSLWLWPGIVVAAILLLTLSWWFRKGKARP